MTTLRTLPALSLLSLLGLACGAEDPADTSTQTTTTTATNPSGIGLDTSSGGQPTGSVGDTDSGPTTSGAEAGQTDTGDTTADVTITGDPTTLTTTTSPATTEDPDTTTLPPDTSTGDTTADTTDATTADTTDATTDATTGDPPPDDCQAPATQPPCDAGTTDIFKAIGLNCSDDKSMAIPIKNPVITAPANNSYRVTTHFGSAKDPMDANLYAWGPKEGERLLAITTGTFNALKMDGGLVKNNNTDENSNNNPDNLADLPGIMTYDKGSNNGNGGTPFMNCDGTKDCSDTLDPQWNIVADNTANDVFYMSFDLDVPVGTHGYLFDFAYFSEEWPYYVDSDFNDMFVVWSTSESFTGNVTFINDQPLTVTALDPYLTIQPGNPLLAGTGFPGDDEGAATGWFTAKASATPGETFTVAISIFDMGDDILDTVGLIDKFRWDCAGCIPSEVDSCGILPQ